MRKTNDSLSGRRADGNGENVLQLQATYYNMWTQRLTLETGGVMRYET